MGSDGAKEEGHKSRTSCSKFQESMKLFSVSCIFCV